MKKSIGLFVLLTLLFSAVFTFPATATSAPVCEPGSAGYNVEGDLRGSINVNGSMAYGSVTNKSTICAYEVGIAAYRMFDSNISNQDLYDYAMAIVQPGQTLKFGPIELPECKAQIDLFYGKVLLSLKGQRYGTRLLAVKFSGTEYCKPVGTEGCTPGYWKNHPEDWVVYSPNQTTSSVFSAASQYGALGSQTLLQSLQGGGGPGTTGAAKILLRAAVAALLNSVQPEVNYPYSPGQIINKVNKALMTNNRQTILQLATKLDEFNNLGCPL
jgi:hypothetical protein